ncbi:hypothetical protein BS50DRAFT_324019 [Corynespora cassiicola Philippines]|uniref:Uncharacterized protein n=1 Tax=Corynespora cassiicola Philippines TaxID=1448308 RepID=A0A2T2NTR2_CORCC|nr:hypothetical protein BS50DRAFT_324019 [Corynespora cassiicola Philippines]
MQSKTKRCTKEGKALCTLKINLFAAAYQAVVGERIHRAQSSRPHRVIEKRAVMRGANIAKKATARAHSEERPQCRRPSPPAQATTSKEMCRFGGPPKKKSIFLAHANVRARLFCSLHASERDVRSEDAQVKLLSLCYDGRGLAGMGCSIGALAVGAILAPRE